MTSIERISEQDYKFADLKRNVDQHRIAMRNAQAVLNKAMIDDSPIKVGQVLRYRKGDKWNCVIVRDVVCQFGYVGYRGSRQIANGEFSKVINNLYLFHDYEVVPQP